MTFSFKSFISLCYIENIINEIIEYICVAQCSDELLGMEVRPQVGLAVVLLVVGGAPVG